MATIRFHANTTATPDQFIAGLTDFGPGRSELFKNSADAYLQVHGVGPYWVQAEAGTGCRNIARVKDRHAAANDSMTAPKPERAGNVETGNA